MGKSQRRWYGQATLQCTDVDLTLHLQTWKAICRALITCFWRKPHLYTGGRVLSVRYEFSFFHALGNRVFHLLLSKTDRFLFPNKLWVVLESNLSLMTVNNNYFQMISFKKLYCIQDYAYSHAISLIHVQLSFHDGREMGELQLRQRRGGVGRVQYTVSLDIPCLGGHYRSK